MVKVDKNVSDTCDGDSLKIQINKQLMLVENKLMRHRVLLLLTSTCCGILLFYLNKMEGDIKDLFSGLTAVMAMWAIFEFKLQFDLKNTLTRFSEIFEQVEKGLKSFTLKESKQLESKLGTMLQNKPDNLLSLYAKSRYQKVNSHVKKLEFKAYKSNLKFKYEKKKFELVLEEFNRVNNHPLTQTKTKLDAVYKKLTERRHELQSIWDATHQNLSWWNKLKYADGPNFSALDADISKSKAISAKFQLKYGNSLSQLSEDYSDAREKATARLNTTYESALSFVNQHYSHTKHTPTYNTVHLLKAAGWAGAFGLSYSIWEDFMTTYQIYDALRSVNGNFDGMSDIEVWGETLWMSESSLVGLASLTKGAYFEQLVASDTQGQLFEHFNHPDTDITIDGIAYQLKATDSDSYINSVEAGIPVIATSEVAETTDAIDSGFTNAELSADVDLAINGMGVDVGDALTDGLLAGLGGLGLFATLRGLEHASNKYNEGSDGETAIFEGIGVAIEGTAKAMVDASEMVYNAAMSKPSRAVGRGIVKVFKKIDKKFEEAEKAKNNR